MKNSKFLLIAVMIVILAVAGLIFILTGIGQQSKFEQEAGRNKEIVIDLECEKYGGTWLSEYEECENISQSLCEFAGGIFFECESPCRHREVDAEEPYFCTMQCVPVCKLGKLELPRGESPENSSYLVDNKVVTLVDGEAEQKESPDSSKKIKTEVFDEILPIDINDDGLEDAALILLQQVNDEADKYYYVSVAINRGVSYQGMNSVFLGKNIDFQGMVITEVMIEASYFNDLGEMETETSATIGVAKKFIFKDGKLMELKINNDKLKMNYPGPYNWISSPVMIGGSSNFFEANTRIRIKDDAGNILADTYATAEGWGDRLYRFSKSVEYAKSMERQGVIEIFEESADNGEEINKAIIPIIFSDFEEDPKIIGGQRDEHDCLVPAGYAWDEEVFACIRSWELDQDEREAVKNTMEYLGKLEGFTALEVQSKNCPGCFTLFLELRGLERTKITMEDWQVVKLDSIDLE